jgi:hypothetical protein
MAAWHRSRRADLGLRALGLGLCVVAYLAISRVVAISQPTQAAGGLAFALAAVGFVSTSAGSAMTLLGKHLFDEIEISLRWQHCPKHSERSGERLPGRDW